MHEVRRLAVLAVGLLAACGGARAPGPPASEPLVIPPMGSAAVSAAPAPAPLPPPPPHTPTKEECQAITSKLVDLTLDSSAMDATQRAELRKMMKDSSFDVASSVCASLKVDDDIMRCVADTTKLEDIHHCLKAATNEGAPDDDRSP